MGDLTFGAIETAYKGYRFRSRLEARWAVFFDALGIEWQYEPEGFEVRYGPDSTDVHRYLPDFYLPKYKTWVEVKGSEDAIKRDLARITAVAESGVFKGASLLFLGTIPDQTRVALRYRIMRTSNGKVSWGATHFAQMEEHLADAYAAARSARFEHGENGGAVDRRRFGGSLI